MNPQTASTPTPGQTDGFKPKWRHFSPLARVWVQNPFEHDVIFQVADEYNRPFRYRLPAGKVSELPGGAIATLGVKAIVNELIQSNKQDEMRMWDENVRAKHEADIILRIKETKPTAESLASGEIDLSVKNDDVPQPAVQAAAAPEVPFPGLNQEPVNAPALDPLPAPVATGISDVVAASLPSSDAVTTPNNANASAEG